MSLLPVALRGKTFILLSAIFLLVLQGNQPIWAADGPLVSTGYFHTCAIQADSNIKCWGGKDGSETTPPNGEFTQISAGAFHTCGIHKDGLVDCWGLNHDGQASPPGGLFKQVSAGVDHTCGLLQDGTTTCWGYNFSGESTPPPSALFLQVSVGGSHSCGLQESGAVECWGSNHSGEASPPPESSFIQISAGAFHTCGLHRDGRVECWGDESFGKTNPPAERFSQISAGRFHTCGIRSDGTVACWGRNNDGQSTPPSGVFLQLSSGQSHTCGVRRNGDMACWGDNDTGRINPPPAEQFTQISTGHFHACGLAENGTVTCWGSNMSGQASVPDGDFVQISAGYLHTCGLRNDGKVACWGDDSWDGQSSPPDETFTQISAGTTHTCGLLIDGSIACWGDNRNGQANAPQGVFIQVSAGHAGHTCGLRSDGSVECWGTDGFGELAVSPSGIFTQISAGEFSNCGLRVDGTIECWGISTFIEPSPSDEIFKQVSAGRGSLIWGEHTCGVRDIGIVECWGSNRHGQATSPSGVFSQVSVGIEYTCGLRPNGRAECWGFNGYGHAVVPEGLRSDSSLFEPLQISYDESRLLNVSTNGQTMGFGMRAGFIVQGQEQRFVVMGENMSGMENPLLKLLNLSDNRLIEQNDDWQSHSTAEEVQSTLRAPGGERDGGFAITLAQGQYYAELQDSSGGGQGLVSVTATDRNNLQQTYPINLSTRGPSPLIAGFIVDGDSARCFIVKAEGPSLGNGTISDPALIVRNFLTGEVIDVSNNWADHPSAAMLAAAGFAPVDEREAALAVRLAQGQYLAELYSVFVAEEGGDSIVAVTELPEEFLREESCDTTRIIEVTPVIPDDPNVGEQVKVIIQQPLSAGLNYYAGDPVVFQGEAVGNISNSPTYRWNLGTGAQLSAGNSIEKPKGIVRYGSAGERTVELTVTVNGREYQAEPVRINILERDSGK